jgi:hypothetical protein
MKHDPAESALKLALDDAELIERIPELQREASAVNYDENGGLILILPRHPAVTAFIQELGEMEYEAADLKTARRRLRAAHDAYQFRIAHRVTPNLTGPAFDRYVSLSAILMARAAGKHWLKVVAGLEHTERIKKHNEWVAARRRDNENAFCLIGDKLYPKDNVS